jgi:hypothetical protein
LGNLPVFTLSLDATQEIGELKLFAILHKSLHVFILNKCKYKDEEIAVVVYSDDIVRD